MSETTKLLLNIPKDVNYKLDVFLAKMKRDNSKKTKHDFIVELIKESLKNKS